MEEFLNELLTFIDKKTDWKVNNDTTNSQVINEFLYRNKELTAQFIASVGKPDSDIYGGLHLACVTTRFQSDKMWAVAMENGQLYTNTLSWTRKSAIEKFMGNMSAELDWRYFKRKYGIHAKKITADFLNGW